MMRRILIVLLLLNGFMLAQDNILSTAIITSTDKGQNVTLPAPYNTVWAGTLKGTVNGENKNFYCVDIKHSLAMNQPYQDVEPTISQVTYILNNYYPYRTNYPGKLTDAKEAAAVQCAIWYFTDTVDISAMTTTDIRTRALAIIDASLLNNNLVMPIRTLILEAPNQSFLAGTPIDFYIETYNAINSPVPGVEITLEATGGSLSTTTIVTNASGVAGPVKITPNPGSYTATVKATGVVTIPQGTKYYHVANPNGRQKLVLATPAIDTKTVFTTLKWWDAIDLSVAKTSSATFANHGDRLTYNITVTNNGTSTATGVIVSDVLTSVLTFVSATLSTGGPADYDPVTGLWQIGSLNGGESRTMTIAADVDYYKVNAAIYDFGPAKDFNLFVLNDINQPSSDTEGKLYVGNNATLANYSVGDKLPENSGDVLIVGRKLTFLSGRVYHGTAVYGQFVDTTHFNLADGGIRQDTVVDLLAATQYLQDLSEHLATLRQTGEDSVQYTALHLVGNNPHQNVFYVDGQDMWNTTDFFITIPDSAIAIVNILGDSCTVTGGYYVNGASSDRILLNFPEAVYLYIHHIDLQSSILAPKATLDFPWGVINGQVVVKNMYGQGQFNHKPFTGKITYDTVLTNIATLAQALQEDITPSNNFSMYQMGTSNPLVGVKENQNVPGSFDLLQNYPNPFNPSTTISYALPIAGFVSLKVFDILGNEVAVLVHEVQNAGMYQINYQPQGLSSGVYLYRIQTGQFTATRKFMLMK